VVLLVGVKLEPDVSRARVRRGGDEIFGSIGYGVTGGNETVRSKKATPREADAERTKFGKVQKVFVEGS
jgi:hypothetical protein